MFISKNHLEKYRGHPTISNKIKRLSESVIEQRCKVVVAPLAHRVAMENPETYAKTDNPILDIGLTEAIKSMRQINVRETMPALLPLTEASIRLS